MNAKIMIRHMQLLMASCEEDAIVCLHKNKENVEKWVKYIAGICVVEKIFDMNGNQKEQVIIHPLYAVGLGYFSDTHFNNDAEQRRYARKFCNASELLEILECVKPDALIKLDDTDETSIVYSICMDKGCIWFEDENDLDMQAELEYAFMRMKEEPKEYTTGKKLWLNFYTSLISDGITSKIVRKYMGDEEADAMEKFCSDYKEDVDRILSI